MKKSFVCETLKNMSTINLFAKLSTEDGKLTIEIYPDRRYLPEELSKVKIFENFYTLGIDTSKLVIIGKTPAKGNEIFNNIFRKTHWEFDNVKSSIGVNCETVKNEDGSYSYRLDFAIPRKNIKELRYMIQFNKIGKTKDESQELSYSQIKLA